MSKKTDETNCISIKPGELYDFEIESWFIPEEFHVKMRLNGVKFENELYGSVYFLYSNGVVSHPGSFPISKIHEFEDSINDG